MLLTIEPGVLGLGRKTAEVKCHFHYTTWSDLNYNSLLTSTLITWLGTCLSGVSIGKLLSPAFSICYSFVLLYCSILCEGKKKVLFILEKTILTKSHKTSVLSLCSFVMVFSMATCMPLLQKSAGNLSAHWPGFPLTWAPCCLAGRGCILLSFAGTPEQVHKSAQALPSL